MPASQTIPRHEMDHATPIYDQLLAEWPHAPGELDKAAQAEMAAYAAELAQQRHPQVRHSAVLDKLSPQRVHVITAVVPLASRLPDPEPIPDTTPPPVPLPEPKPGEDPQDAVEAPQEAAEPGVVPEDPSDPSEAVTALLERVAPTEK
jgi:hypothetical protein